MSEQSQDGSPEGHGGGRDAMGRWVKGGPFGWKPGESGSLRGRRDSLSDWLNRIGDEVTADGVTNREAFARRIWKMALDPKTSRQILIQLAAWVADRTEGRPVQAVRVDQTNRTIVIELGAVDGSHQVETQFSDGAPVGLLGE
jgi:hypothetical protein